MIKVLSANDNFSAEDGVLAGGIDWSVSKKTLIGGLQQGVEVLQVDNGNLQFDVVLTRGMSVGPITCGQVRLGWDSPVICQSSPPSLAAKRTPDLHLWTNPTTLNNSPNLLAGSRFGGT